MPQVTIVDGADIAVKHRGSVYAINVTDWSATSKHDIAGNILLNERISYYGAVWVHANNDLAHDVFACSVDFDASKRCLVMYAPRGRLTCEFVQYCRVTFL